MAADLLFYTNPMSRGQIARWMLEEVGQPYEQVVLSYGGEMKSPEYLAINPMGKVPAIVHAGQVVTECAAICAYLADAFPEAGLLPDPEHRGAYFRWLLFAAGPLEAAIIDRALHVQVPPEMERSAGYGTYERTIDTLEQAVTGKDYIAGNRFSAADVYVGAHIDWGLTMGTIPSRPAFEAYVAKLRTRPAYRRQKEIDHALIEASQQQPHG